MRAVVIGLCLSLFGSVTADAEATSSRPSSTGYQAPTRSVTQLSFAIHASHPGLSGPTRERLARLLIEVAREHNFDPLSGWAIIDHESNWRADAVGPDGEDIGLAQIRYTASRACRQERPSAACEARREALFDPAFNIRAMAGAITAWRTLCEEVTGRPTNIVNWLAGYGGYSRPSKHVYCGRKREQTLAGERWQELPVPGPVADIVARRAAMLRRLRDERIR